MAHPGETAEQIIARIAIRAHGVVTRGQLLEAGLTRDEIRHRLACGSLLAVHRGVYRAGHRAPSVDASYLAAVYACGTGAVLSGVAAAFNFGVLRGPPCVPEVTARTRRRIPGVTTHHVRRLDRRDTTIWRRIPTVTIARALVEVAGALDIEQLARACHEAGVRYGTAPRHVAQALARRPNAPGAAKLRAVMGGEIKVSLSRLESRFLELLRAEGVALPVTNRPAGRRRVDCRWPDRRLTVELDSYGYHNSRYAWERDHAREREAYARGDEFRRYTWGDVFERPDAVLAELRPLLSGVRPDGG